ncbi:hypothetical protein BDV11DRAFT_181014 [Aspergillus similis]
MRVARIDRARKGGTKAIAPSEAPSRMYLSVLHLIEVRMRSTLQKESNEMPILLLCGERQSHRFLHAATVTNEQAGNPLVPSLHCPHQGTARGRSGIARPRSYTKEQLHELDVSHFDCPF